MRNYAEAVKCYQQALKLDPDNVQILKDMAMLQVQIRDLEGHYDTRYTLLKSKPNLSLNWLSLTVAAHLVGKKKFLNPNFITVNLEIFSSQKDDLDQAFRILESTWNTITQNDLKPYERSEVKKK